MDEPSGQVGIPVRPPLAPSRAPLDDNETGSGLYNIGLILGYGRDNVAAQTAANRVVELFEEPSILVENMVGAFAQRCDNLMNDLGASQEAPGLFGPGWVVSAYEAGLMNERWMLYWSTMRPRKAQS